MEGSLIRGPFAAGEKTVVKMGTRIYGATSAGPSCILGGEIKNSVIFGYSNKAHDGYLGDSVIGEWCNLGAGSTNSNLKNSGGSIKLWNPLRKKFTDGGLKCGLMMGDYSRSAINTAFNTGTVVGVSCHVFGDGATPAFLPSFSWGKMNSVYTFDNAIQHIGIWKKFKGREINTEEINRLKYIFDQQNPHT
jgi:UDP-N-acetylglucosamine diphosphorylase/glucosamine-1-phosphate N-acetyltransferase